MSLTARATYLDSLCEISVNGHITRKMDFLGTVTICGRYYFNVFRRYNSVYEIVIEDFNGDYHFHKDYTVRQSLQRILCLSDEKMQGLYTHNVTSFKYNSCPLTMKDAPNMRWSEVQALWQAAAMEFRGILEDYHTSPVEDVKDEFLSPESHVQQAVEAPQAPHHKLTHIIIDESHESHLPLSKGTNLSDRFRAVEDKKRTWTQLSESESEYEESDEEEEEESDEEEEEEEEKESDEEEDEEEEKESDEEESLFCMRLRSGTTINK